MIQWPTRCWGIFAFWLIAGCGCTVSVHPVLLKEDVITDIDLSGQWLRVVDPQSKEKPPKSPMKLERVSNSPAYDLEGEDGQELSNALRLGKLGDLRLLEVRGGPRDRNSPFQSGLPVYVFAKVELLGDEMRVHCINDPAMRGLLDEHKVDYLCHTSGPDDSWLVITANTATLQELIKTKHDQIFLKSAIVYRRISQR